MHRYHRHRLERGARVSANYLTFIADDFFYKIKINIRVAAYMYND